MVAPLAPRAASVVLLFFAAAAAPTGASAQNFPPVAVAEAVPTTAIVGESIRFSGSGSYDPDDGPSPLTYEWELDDGTHLSGAVVDHAFAAAGKHGAILTVSDGDRTGITTLAVVVSDELASEVGVASSTIVATEDGSAVVVVNPDSGSISVIDTASMAMTEVPACDAPRALALAPPGDMVAVACERSSEVVLVGLDGVVRSRIAVPGGPSGICVRPSDALAVVSLPRRAEIALLDLATFSFDTLPVASDPRAVAIDALGERAFVTHFITRGASATVSVIDLGTRAVTEIALGPDPAPDTASSGGGYPNLLSAIAFDPTGRELWVGGLKSNSDRGVFLRGEALLPPNRVRGVALRIDLSTLSDRPLRRIDTNDADSASAIAFSRDGRYAFVTHRGMASLSVYDLPVLEGHDASDGTPPPRAAQIDVGAAPSGLTVSPDGIRLYVDEQLERTVAIVDVSDPLAPTIIARVPTTAEPLAPAIAIGKRLFNSSRGPVMSQDNYIACASCHPGGAMDGRTWDFTDGGEGLRNTIDLRGRAGMGHGPVHWSANFDEIQDFENDIVHAFGGTGLAADGDAPYAPLGAQPNAGRSAELDALAAYVATLDEAPMSPYRNADGSLGDDAVRGREIFSRDDVGCVACHAPPRFTDSTLTGDPATFILHDVGTLGAGSGGRLGGPLTGLDTPTLIGVFAGAPYLHDGSAESVRDVLTTRNLGGRHGRTSHLSPAELDDLVVYVSSIDGRGDEPVDGADAGVPDAGAPDGSVAPPVGANGCGCRVTPAKAAPTWTWLALVLLGTYAWRRR